MIWRRNTNLQGNLSEPVVKQEKHKLKLRRSWVRKHRLLEGLKAPSFMRITLQNYPLFVDMPMLLAVELRSALFLKSMHPTALLKLLTIYGALKIKPGTQSPKKVLPKASCLM